MEKKNIFFSKDLEMCFVGKLKNLSVVYILFCTNFSLSLFGKELLMTKTEQKHLENFCHAMMWSSQMGYVLYGDKPICLEGYSKTVPSSIFHVGNHLQSAISLGIWVWNRIQLPLESSKFALIDQSIDYESSLILFINKEALKKVFDENSMLFRYILGHELTADKLLNAFKYNDFFSS